MKKLFFLTALYIMFVQSVSAKPISYLEEVRYLGIVAGQGLACNAEKYHTFELLARAILVSKAQSDQQQEAGMKEYNEQKADTFITTISDGLNDCEEINSAFNAQKIFKSTLYGDGSIKMFDGKMITPRHPYDATLIYKKDPNARDKYMELYQKTKEKILNDPVYKQKIRELQRQQNYSL